MCIRSKIISHSKPILHTGSKSSPYSPTSSLISRIGPTTVSFIKENEILHYLSLLLLPFIDTAIVIAVLVAIPKYIGRSLLRTIGSVTGLTGSSLWWLRNKYENTKGYLNNNQKSYFQAQLLYRITYPKLDFKGYHEMKILLKELENTCFNFIQGKYDHDRTFAHISKIHPKSVKLFKHVSDIEIIELHNGLRIIISLDSVWDLPILPIREKSKDRGKKLALKINAQRASLKVYGGYDFFQRQDIIESKNFWVIRSQTDEIKLQVNIINGVIDINCPKPLLAGKEFRASLTLLALKIAIYRRFLPGVDKIGVVLDKLPDV